MPARSRRLWRNFRISAKQQDEEINGIEEELEELKSE